MYGKLDRATGRDSPEKVYQVRISVLAGFVANWRTLQNVFGIIIDTLASAQQTGMVLRSLPTAVLRGPMQKLISSNTILRYI